MPTQFGGSVQNMRLRTALACSAFLLVVFTIAVWSSPLPDTLETKER